MEKHEVVIVGAGPAGLHSAKILAENGRDVLVLEQLPEKGIGDKACAGVFTSKSIEVIRPPSSIYDIKSGEWDVVAHLVNKDIKIKGDEFGSPTVNRKKMGQWQVREAKKAGVTILDKSKVIGVNKGKNELLVEKEKIFGYDYLLGADGAKSIIRRSLGLKVGSLMRSSYTVPGKFERGDFFFDWKKYGSAVCYVIPHMNYGVFGVLWYDESYRTAEEKHKNFDLECEKRFGIKPTQHKGGYQLTGTDYEGYKFGNIYLIGDAGGFADHNYGEGIYFALKSGELIAKLICGEPIKKEIKNFLTQKKRHEEIKIPLAIYRRIPRKLLREFVPKSVELGYKIWENELVFDVGKTLFNIGTKIFIREFVWN
jgi:geranylgeranyl reductase